MADNPLNAVNRGVYISDNLKFRKGLNSRCIDLPFTKKARQLLEQEVRPHKKGDAS